MTKKRYQVYLNTHAVRVFDEMAEVLGRTRSDLIREMMDAAAHRAGNLLAVFKPPEKIDYSWWDKMEGSVTVGDSNKTVNVSENVDEIYYR